MLKYQIYQSQLRDSMSYGKFYARIVSNETINMDALAEHMVAHNSPFSKGTILGILQDFGGCVRELLLDGNRIQLDGLASFGLSVEHMSGAPTAQDFSVSKNVKSVRLTAQGIGEFSKSVLMSSAVLGESTTYASPRTMVTDPSTDMNGGENVVPGTENEGPDII